MYLQYLQWSNCVSIVASFARKGLNERKMLKQSSWLETTVAKIFAIDQQIPQPPGTPVTSGETKPGRTRAVLRQCKWNSPTTFRHSPGLISFRWVKRTECKGPSILSCQNSMNLKSTG